MLHLRLVFGFASFLQSFNPYVEALHDKLSVMGSAASVSLPRPPSSPNHYVVSLHQKLAGIKFGGLDSPPVPQPSAHLPRSHTSNAEFKKQGNSGPRGGKKAPNQLLVRAEYSGQLVELHLVDIITQSYSWHALKSKVTLCWNGESQLGNFPQGSQD